MKQAALYGFLSIRRGLFSLVSFKDLSPVPFIEKSAHLQNATIRRMGNMVYYKLYPYG